MIVKFSHKVFVALTVAMTFLEIVPSSRAASEPTTTTLSITAGDAAVTTVKAGTVVTLTATVKAGSVELIAGRVDFCDAAAKYCTDIHLLGTVQLTSAGTAVLRLRPSLGAHSFKAVFLGTPHGSVATATSASGPAVLTVTGKNPSATVIAQSGYPGNYTLTATVGGGFRASSFVGSLVPRANARAVSSLVLSSA